MIRIGLIGTGYIARRSHLPNFTAMDGVEVCALYNRTREKAEAANADFCGAKACIHDDWRALIDDPAVDAVVICTTVNLHSDQAIAAALAGKHVLVEKPMALTLDAADAMIAAAESAGVLLMVDHGLRFYPPYAEVHHVVRSGVMGPVHSIGMFAGHAGAERRGPEGVPWYKDPGQGGGCFVDLGVHEVDMMRWLLNRPIERVSAFFSTHKPRLHGECDDNAVVNLAFEGGALGNIRESWTLKPGFERNTLIVLEGGYITIRGERVVVHEARRDEPRMLDIPGLPGHGIDKRHFIECIRTGSTPLTNGREGRETLRVVLAAIESARSGQVIELNG